MADKIFCGSGKKRTGQYGEFFSISFSQKDYEEMGKHMNEKGYINLVMNERNEVGKYGDTHSITVDTWKPKQEGVGGLKQKAYGEVDVTDIPFR